MLVFHDFSFESARRLPNLPADHPCSRLHGNTFRLRIGVQGAVDERIGWVIDFADVAEIAGPVISEIDHCLLNDVPGLDNPTTELIAKWLWQKLIPGLPGLAEVWIWETDTTGCVYKGD